MERAAMPSFVPFRESVHRELVQDAWDAYEQELDAQCAVASQIQLALGPAFEGGLAALDALAKSQSMSEPLDAAFPAWEALIELRDEYDERAKRTAEARQALDDVAPSVVIATVASVCKDREATNKVCRAAIDSALAAQGCCIVLGGVASLEMSEKAADDFAGRVARVRMSEPDAQQHVRIGLMTLLREQSDRNFKGLIGKRRPYLTVALRRRADTEKARFCTNDGFPEAPTDRVDPDTLANGASSPLEVLLAVAAETEVVARVAALGEFVKGLPADLRELLALWSAGVPPTEARRRLGLKLSRETALRGRIARWKARLDRGRPDSFRRSRRI